MFWFKEVWEGNKQIIHTEDVFMHRSYMLWRNAIIGWLGGGGGGGDNGGKSLKGLMTELGLEMRRFRVKWSDQALTLQVIPFKSKKDTRLSSQVIAEG